MDIPHLAFLTHQPSASAGHLDRVVGECWLYSAEKYDTTLDHTGMVTKGPMLRQLGEYLRNIREGHGWSQEDLAFECGLHRTYVGAVERGEYNVTLLTLRRITDTLGISLADAMKGATERRPKRR